MSVVVEADDVDWRKRKPKDGGEMGRPRVRKKSEGFIRESGSSSSDIAAWAKKWHDEDAPKTMMNYGSVVTKESIARSKKAVRKGPSLLGVLAAQPHQTRDARSRFNDPKKSKAAPSATQQSTRPIVVQRSPVQPPRTSSPVPAAAPVSGGLTDEQRLTIERNKAMALARRKNRLSAFLEQPQPAKQPTSTVPQPRQRHGRSMESAESQPVAKRSGLFFNRNRNAAAKSTTSLGPKRVATDISNSNDPAKPWHQFKQIMSVNEVVRRKSSARVLDQKIALLGYAREIQISQAFHNGRTQSRTALLLVDGSHDEPVALQVFTNSSNSLAQPKDTESQPCLVLCTSLTIQQRPKLVVTAGALHKLVLTEEEAAGDQHAQVVTRWWAQLPSHLRRAAFEVGKKKQKRRKRVDTAGSPAASTERDRPQKNSLDRFLRAASDILGDDADEPEETNAESSSAGRRHVGWGDDLDHAADTSKRTDGKMFSPPASAIKSPGMQSSQSSDSSGPSLSQSPQARPLPEVSASSDITASALYERIQFIVETGDAATLTKRSVRQTLTIEYGTDFVKWNKAEINRLITDAAATVMSARNEAACFASAATDQGVESHQVAQKDASSPLEPDHPPPRNE